MSPRKQFMATVLKLIVGISAGLAIAAHLMGKESLCYGLFAVSGLAGGILQLIFFFDCDQ